MEKRITATKTRLATLGVDGEITRTETMTPDLQRLLQQSEARNEALRIEAQDMQALLAQSQDLLQRQVFSQCTQMDGWREHLAEMRVEHEGQRAHLEKVTGTAIRQMEETIAAKDAHILHLEETIATHNAHTFHMEELIAMKDVHIIHVGEMLATKNAHILSLEETIATKNAHILHMEAEVSRLEGILTTRSREIGQRAARALRYPFAAWIRFPRR